MMTPERFKVLVASYGADLKRWPENEQDDAAMLLSQQPEMSLIINHESALDSLLAEHSILTTNSALADVIFANALNSLMVKEKTIDKPSSIWQRLSNLLAETGLSGLGFASAGLASALAGIFCVSLLTSTISPKAMSHEDSANGVNASVEYLDYGQEWR